MTHIGNISLPSWKHIFRKSIAAKLWPIYLDCMGVSVYEFLDFRDYLRAVYTERKEKQKFFSHRYFLRQVGVKNSGFLALVIEGKRSLTDQMVPKFAKALGLREQELLYFKCLVDFCQAKTSEEKEDCYRQLRLLKSKITQKVITPDLFDIYENWYTPVIRELVCLQNFADDYARIGSSINPPVKAKEVEKSLKLLLERKMLTRNENGTYAQTDPVIDTTDEISSLIIRRFNRQMISIAAESQDRWNKTERYVRGYTMGISHKTYELLLAEIQRFNERVVQIAGSNESGERVYQMNFQLFPLTKAQTKLRQDQAPLPEGKNE